MRKIVMKTEGPVDELRRRRARVALDRALAVAMKISVQEPLTDQDVEDFFPLGVIDGRGSDHVTYRFHEHIESATVTAPWFLPPGSTRH